MGTPAEDIKALTKKWTCKPHGVVGCGKCYPELLENQIPLPFDSEGTK